MRPSFSMFTTVFVRDFTGYVLVLQGSIIFRALDSVSSKYYCTVPVSGSRAVHSGGLKLRGRR